MAAEVPAEAAAAAEEEAEEEASDTGEPSPLKVYSGPLATPEARISGSGSSSMLPTVIAIDGPEP